MIPYGSLLVHGNKYGKNEVGYPNMAPDLSILQHDLSTSDLHLTGISVIKSKNADEEEEEDGGEEEEEDKDEEELPPSSSASPLRPPSPPLR